MVGRFDSVFVRVVVDLSLCWGSGGVVCAVDGSKFL